MKTGKSDECSDRDGFFRYPAKVRLEWIDSNGHMNVKPYAILFSDACDAALSALGFLQGGDLEKNFALFTAEIHITYIRELPAGAPLLVLSCVSEMDEKRFILHQQLFNLDGDYLAATAEHLSLNVDLATRRVGRFAAEALERLRARLLAPGATLPNRGRAASLRVGAPDRT